jgi:translation elongation factor EF-Tu-like GTPase
MATRKKAKAKRLKKPARRPVARKKTPAARKTVARKKPVVRGAAKKKKPIARGAAKKAKPAPRPAQIRKAQPARAPSMPARPAAAAPAPAPMVGEERIGTVTHYYGHLSVAAVHIESGSLRVGDMIHVVGSTSDFSQRVESLQIEHQPVSEARAGQEIGLKVTEHAREHDIVYKAAASYP